MQNADLQTSENPGMLTRRGFITCAGGVILATALLPGCSSAETQEAVGGIDYLVLVNKQHKLPDDWESTVEIVEFSNTEGWDVKVEAKAYDAYLQLKEDLEADGVYVDLDSAYRSVAEQQEIVDDFTERYGEEYVKAYVAVPGYSEHHTGLALDLFLIIDGVGVTENEDMVLYPEVWEKIHAKLADHGFILRYLPGKKIETGYSYEPWHIRYLDDVSIASEIMEKGLTFEAYLDEVEPCVKGCEVDYGTSELYEEPDMDAALDTILMEFRTWDGCVMQRFAFSGDEMCGADELAYVNELRESTDPSTEAFDQAIVFITDFHTPADAGGAWEPDADYKDYTWHLGRTGDNGEWNLMSWGYA